MYPKEIEELHTAIENIRREAAVANGKTFVLRPIPSEGSAYAFEASESSIYLRYLNSQGKSIVPNYFLLIQKHMSPTSHTVYYTDEPPFTEAQAKARSEQQARQDKLRGASSFAYKVLRKFMERININSMSLTEADELWSKVHKETLETSNQNEQRWSNYVISPFGIVTKNKDYKIGDSATFYMNLYLRNRVVEILSSLPREVKEFLNKTETDQYGWPIPICGPSILLKEYEEIVKRLNNEPTIRIPMTTSDLAKLFTDESATILNMFKHYEKVYKESIQSEEIKFKAEQTAVVRTPGAMAATDGQQDAFIEFETVRRFIRRVDITTMDIEVATKLWAEITRDVYLDKRINPNLKTEFNLNPKPYLHTFRSSGGFQGRTLIHRYLNSLVWCLITEAAGHQALQMPEKILPHSSANKNFFYQSAIKDYTTHAIKDYTTHFNRLKKPDTGGLSSDC